MIIDFHSHILPGIDDGSPDISCTEELLREEMRQGVGCICATPHFYASHVSVHDFLVRREEAFVRTRHMCAAKGLAVPILCGAEVYYFPGMGEADKLPELTLAGSDVLLLEMPFAQWTDAMVQEIKKILYRQQLTVVLAHLERYFPFQKKKGPWEEILDLPVIVQLNAGCVFERKKYKFALKMLASDLPVVLGSDCHNMDGRKPNLEEGRALLAKKAGWEAVNAADTEAAGLLARLPKLP